ncbi:MAG TPA: hypothetical protein VHS28_04495 [Chloroflexota bacterium]|nr:hypothetical protein [Chloroflexota bacterium]
MSTMGEPEQEEYDLMMLLDQLETIKEEMEELGVSTLAEVEARIDDVSRKLDEMQKNGQ